MNTRTSPLVDLLLSIIIPSFILMKFSGDDQLGATSALIVALSLPLSLGLYQLIRFKLANYIALLGVVSVLLTGGIGLLKLDVEWLAIKEAAIPAVLGFAVLIAARLRYPLLKKILFNPLVLNTEKISTVLRQRGCYEIFDARLSRATYMISGTFFFSATMNYLLAKLIVTSPSGSEAFNEELGRLTLISYPMIAIPSLILMLVIFYFLWRGINQLTGLTLEEALASSPQNDG